MKIFLPLFLTACALLSFCQLGAEKDGRIVIPENLLRENLVPWCIVPFDASKRSPEERTKMLVRLGLKRSAYDWRAQHVPEFEEEILQYQKHGIEFFAFWNVHENAFELFQKHKINPQIWKTLRSPKSGTGEEKIDTAKEAMFPLAKRTAEIGCKLGLYNHGGWGGNRKTWWRSARLCGPKGMNMSGSSTIGTTDTTGSRNGRMTSIS